MTKLKGTTVTDSSIFYELANFGLKYHHAVAEIVDNALSAGLANQKKATIRIKLEEIKGGFVKTTISDDSGGIPDTVLEKVLFSLSTKTTAKKTVLNEHGMGFLNVMSVVEDQKGSWILSTSNDSRSKSDKCLQIKSPYPVGKDVVFKEINNQRSTSIPGTDVSFTVPIEYAAKVSSGMKGQNPKNVDAIASRLKEHLGVFYRNYINKPNTSIEIHAPGFHQVVPAIDFALISQITKIKPFTVDSGKVKISGSVGLIAPVKTGTYYYANTSSSRGVDVIFGERVIQSRVMKGLWPHTTPHPSHNQLAGQIVIEVKKKGGRLPKTLPDKSGIKDIDPLWTEIRNTIIAQIPSPPKSKSGGKTAEKSEEELQDELHTILSSTLFDDKKYEVSTRQPVDSTSNIEADILVVQKRSSIIPLVVECKRGQIAPIDVYQLIMYWHSITQTRARNDGRGMMDVKEGLLVGDGISPGALNLLKRVKKMTYEINGKRKKFNIKHKKWSEYSIKLT